jgi:hypothetical protein
MSRTKKLEEQRQLHSERLSFMTSAGPIVDDGFVTALRALLASEVSKGGASLRMARVVPMRMKRRGVETRLSYAERYGFTRKVLAIGLSFG